MIQENIEAQKVKDELLYMRKDHVTHNIPLNKRALLNSLVGVGLTYRICEEDREIIVKEDAGVALRIAFISINNNDITLVFMRPFKSFFLRGSNIKYWYYKKFNCYNKELYGEV